MRVIINPKYAHLQKEIENIPVSFNRELDVVYDGRNILKRMSLGGVDVVVKSFKQPHVINRIVYSFFRQSKAARSFLYSMQIQEHGFCTPEPVAMIEQLHKGLLSHSYYICCYDNGETVRSLMGGSVQGYEDKLKAFARYTADLHQAGILHLDYSPGNILIHEIGEKEYHFSLVDVNRMCIMSEIDCDTVCRNVSRLCTSREALTYIMTEYALQRGWDVEKTIDLSLHYTNQFFRRYVFRRALRKETSRHIVSYILLFRIYRSCRSLFPSSFWLSSCLLKEERNIYNSYLQKYDYQNIFFGDYSN